MFIRTTCILHLPLLVMLFCAPIQTILLTNVVNKTGPSESPAVKLLRQRRYLIFPTGSSVQLVYESGITIPDYTLYITTGITVALAWNLPDKPTYPELKHNERIENGSSVDQMMMTHRMDENDTVSTDYDANGTVNTDSTTLISANTIRSTYLKPSKNHIFNRILNHDNHYFQNRRPDSYYFGRNSTFHVNSFEQKLSCKHRSCPTHGYSSDYYSANDRKENHKSTDIGRRPHSSTTYHSANPSNDAHYMIETYFKPWIESTLNRMKSPKILPKYTRDKAAKTPKSKPPIRKLHTIYPTLRQRYVRDIALTYEQKFYLDHHRWTRHRLYEIIQKYLFAKGYNGTECVLKTLCEVRQKQHETQPGSFLVEILRAVFSLPVAQLQNAVQKQHIDYDKAHQFARDCAMDFPLCPENIWNAPFIIESDATIVHQNNVENVLINSK